MENINMTVKEKIWCTILVVIVPMLIIYALFINKDAQVLEKKIDVVELKKELSSVKKNDTLKLEYKTSYLNIDSINSNWDFKKDSLLKNFVILNEKFSDENQKLYLHKNFSQNMQHGNHIRMSISENNKSLDLVLLISYVNENWLFMNEIKFLIDGELFEIDLEILYNVEREVHYGGVSEIVVIPVNSSQSILNLESKLYSKLSNKINKIEVKYLGDKGAVEFKLTSKQITSINETLELYKHLKLKY